ncbi:MAG: glucokinase, partial [Cyanobacteria bacterium J06635_13]
MNGSTQLETRKSHSQADRVFLASPKSDVRVGQETILLAGDIGGTKTILRLVKLADGLNFKTIHQQKYSSAQFPDLVPMVQQFLSEVKGAKPQAACFAIAGAVMNQTSRL